MPRRARLALAGVAWHIIQRGNNRSACFFADDDYQFYLSVLNEQAFRCGCAVHAYVLMTNHVHLLLTPSQAEGPSLLMKHVGQRYCQYVNRRYGRSGSLWEGRFRSTLAQNENYVLICHRYIEMNPVRAGMAASPSQYRWSSYRANAFGLPNPALTAHEDYLSLAPAPDTRRARYRDLFIDELPQDVIDQIRSATVGNVVLGDESFESQLASILSRRASRGKPGRPRKA